MADRRRNLLHRSRAEEFIRWAITRGWSPEFTGHNYEFVRLRHEDGGEPAIVYDRDRGDHLTTFGASTRLAREFVEAGYSIDA